jgi:FAD/FMN-containing dehydrogenase
VDDQEKKLAAIVGNTNLVNDPGQLEQYASDRSFARRMTPRYIVKPQKAEQVQELVKWANQTRTPLVPVSSGTPHFKGDTVPSVPEAVIVDLSGLNKILSINKLHRMAVIEPGVTYGEFQSALAKEGLTFSTSLAPKASKSVVASVLEVEPRLNAMHQWNYLDPLRCVEVTWGDGNRMFTGEAGGSVMDLKQQWSEQKWQVEPVGPMMLDFYRLLTGAQGSMGIVTWASLKCELLPRIHKMYLVPGKSLADLTDFVYKVVRVRFSDELFIMNSAYLAALMGESAEQIKALRAELPPWVVLVGIAGRELLPEERVSAQEQDIADIAQQCGLALKSSVVGARGEQVLQKVINPSPEKYWKDTLKGAFQDIFFVTALDQTSKFIDKMYSLAEQAGYSSSDIGIYIQPQHLGSSYHCEFYLPYDTQNSREVAAMQTLFKRASEELAGMGAYYARPYGIWSRLQLNRDAQSAITLKKLKGIFDPNNIMNPEKLSI